MIRDTHGTLNTFSTRLPGSLPSRVGLIVFAVLAIATFFAANWVNTQVRRQVENRGAERAAFAADEASVHYEMVMSDISTIASFIEHTPGMTQGTFVSFTRSIKEAGLCAPSVRFLGYAVVRGDRLVVENVFPPNKYDDMYGKDLASIEGLVSAVRGPGSPHGLENSGFMHIDSFSADGDHLLFVMPVGGPDSEPVGYAIAIHDAEVMLEVVLKDLLTRSDSEDPLIAMVADQAGQIKSVTVAGDDPVIPLDKDPLQTDWVPILAPSWSLSLVIPADFGLTPLQRWLGRIVLAGGLLTGLVASLGAFRLAQLRARTMSRIKNAEAALDQVEGDLDAMNNQVKVVIEAAQEGILLVDAERKILWVNSSLQRMLSARGEGYVGMGCDELFAGLDVSIRHGILERNGEIYSDHTLSIVDEDIDMGGDLGLTLTRSSFPVMSNSGTYLGRLWIYRDVSDIRAADLAKSNFVSMVSHELRTPLTALHANLEMLVDGLAGDLNELQDRLASNGFAASQQLRILIDDLLDISQVDSGTIDVELQSVAIDPIIKSAIEAVRASEPKRQVEILTALSRDLPCVVADSRRLGQVITNLVSNAVRYSEDGSVVEIRASAVGDRLRIVVADSGIGIPEQYLDAIWAPFFRVPTGRARPRGSTGLGLAITRSLVELQHGSISVDSEIGSGSRFTVELPIDPNSADRFQNHIDESHRSPDRNRQTGNGPILVTPAAANDKGAVGAFSHVDS